MVWHCAYPLLWRTFVLMNRSLFIVFLGCCLSGKSLAQQMPGGFPSGFGGRQSMPTSTTGGSGQNKGIIDDSTKVIYGPKSTRYVLEEDVFNNRKKLYTMDTTMDEVHRFTYVQRSRNLYQDLGTLGTAMRPVFVQMPQQLGAQSGYTVFSPYAFQSMEVKYYDTKSPFSDMYLALGGRSQNILRFSMAQNVTKRWNVGLDLQRFTSQKQFGTTGSSDPYKILAQNWGIVGHTNYRSKNEKYTLLANFINMSHSVDEQGGIIPGTGGITSGSVSGSNGYPYNYEGDAMLRSGSASVQGPHGWDIRNNWHVYHQYIQEKGLQLYHRLDLQTQKNFYGDNQLKLNRQTIYPADTTVKFQIYPSVIGAVDSTTRIFQRSRYRVLENQFGLKGIAQYKGSSFNYRAYLRIRNYTRTLEYDTTKNTGILTNYKVARFETFVGGWLGYYFPDSLTRLTAEAELGVNTSGNVTYRLQGQLVSKWLTAGYSSIAASPTLLQEFYQAKVLNWENKFSLPIFNHAYGKLNLRYKQFRLEPSLDYYLITNYIYFDEHAAAKQDVGSFFVTQPGIGYHLPFGRFSISGQAYYTFQSRDDVLRTPPVFVNTQLQYEFIYAKVLHIQTGIDLHYKSAYLANAYMPVTQQYYLQNKQTVEGCVLADLYANLRVNRTRLFVKVSHINQGFLQGPGYFVDPNYLQMRRAFSFGVDWYLFD